MNRMILVAALVSFCASAYGQSAVRIGMTRKEVNAAVGVPVQYYDAGTQLHLDAPPPVVKGPLYEVHTRKTASNEYEINVNYTVDASTSRLHPTLRVLSGFIRFDRPEKVMNVLQDSVEIAALCINGCRMQVFKFRSPPSLSLALPKNLQKYAVTQAEGRASETPIEICVSDTAKTESIFLRYQDEDQNMRDVSGPDSPVSEVSFEKYLEFDSTAIESRDAGTWRTSPSN